MIDYSALPHHDVLCIDMKSFYASCECVSLGLDPLKAYLAVIGDKKFQGSIVLASSPMMKKKYGIKTGSRLFEIPQDPKIHLVEARMAYYLSMSINITRLLTEFVPFEAIHVYSIDEAWLCLDGTKRLWGEPWEAAQKIKTKIEKCYGIPCCIGIGPNKFLAKVILDTEAKVKGIAECQYGDIPKKLWNQPVEKIWGIGRRMKVNLNRMGIYTLGHLANYPVDNLKKRFGIMGEQLYWHAWGVDLSPVIGQRYDLEEQKGFGHGITLMRDYKKLEEIKVVILELCEEVARRAREAHRMGRTVSLGIGYSQVTGGGFHRTRTMEQPTNITSDIYQVCLQLLAENYAGEIVRRINVALTNLLEDQPFQGSLFDNSLKEHKLGYVVDQIRDKFGSTSLLRAQSFTDAGIMLDRAKKIGGHKA